MMPATINMSNGSSTTNANTNGNGNGNGNAHSTFSDNKTISIWGTVVDGNFDAGFLIDEPTGAILHINEPALALFERDNIHNGNDHTRDNIDQYVSFWTTSLDKDDDDEDDDDEEDDDDGKHPPKPGTRVRLAEPDDGEDTQTWTQVVQHASTKDKDQRVLEWTVSGIIHEPAANTNTSDSTTSATSKRTFPGVLRLTAVPSVTATNGSNNNNNNNNMWLAFVRHADHHDIIRSGNSVSHANHGLRTNETDTSGGRVKRSSRSTIASFRVSARGNKIPRITVDHNGVITEVTDAALDLDVKNPIWKWITTDLVGQHISATDICQKRPPTTATNSTPPPQARKKRGPGMLDLILESGMEPGHSSCPMSGFPLRPDIKANASAMTTGAAQREENITEAAFEAALDPIFQINEHGKIQMVNSAAVKTFGWKRSEFLGSNISMICGGGHAAKHSAYMARYLATGETRVIGKNRELIAKRKDGSEFPIELGVVEVDTFAGEERLFCGFVRDLTGIKARERLAQEMVKGALDPVFQINGTGTILMVNDAALKTFGYERDELIGHNVSIICGGSHASSHDLYMKRYIRTGEQKVIGKYRELPAKRKDGSEFLIQLAVTEILGGDGGGTNSSIKREERMFCGFVHDLSRQKRDQDIMSGTIDTSLDPVLHINENGIIQMVNNATVSHLGWTREELVGENVSLIVGGEHRKDHGKYIERYLETGEKRAIGKKRKLKARRKDGSEMDIELGLSEIKLAGGKESMFCAFLTDLGSRQKDV